MRKHQWRFHISTFLILFTACLLVILYFEDDDFRDGVRSLLSQFLGTFAAIYFTFIIFLLTKKQTNSQVDNSKQHLRDELSRLSDKLEIFSQKEIIAQREIGKQLGHTIMTASEHIIETIERQQPHVFQDDLRIDIFEFEIDRATANLNIQLYSAIVKYQELEVFKWFRASSLKRIQLKYQHKEIDYIKEELKRLETAKKKFVN